MIAIFLLRFVLGFISLGLAMSYEERRQKTGQYKRGDLCWALLCTLGAALPWERFQ